MAKDRGWVERQPKGSAGNGPVDTAGQVGRLLGKDHLGPDVIRTLAALGDDVVPALGAIATGARPAPAYEQENAVYALGMIGQDGAVDYLTQVLWTPELNLQLLAARALGRIGTPPALAELRRLYNGAAAPPAAPPQAAAASSRPAPDFLNGRPAPAAPVARAASGGPRPLPPALAMELREVLGHLEPPGDGSRMLHDSETIYPPDALD